MSKMLCVLRTVRGIAQYVPLADAVNLQAGERVFIGDFAKETEKDGPSGSHTRTICLPRGILTEANIPAAALRNGKLVDGASVMECVIREVEPGDHQYRPVTDVTVLHPGERTVFGVFRTQRENHGPHGSHSMLIALPLGKVSDGVYAVA